MGFLLFPLKLCVKAVLIMLQITALLIGVISLTGFWGDMNTPFELISHFRVAFAAIFFAFSLFFLLCRMKLAAATSAVLLAVNAFPILPLYMPLLADNDPQYTSVKVLEFNVQGGKNKNYKSTIATIKSTDPDIVGVTEITGGWAKVLKAELSDYPYQVVEPRYGGVSLFSKFPVLNSEVKFFGPLKRPRIHASIGLNGQPVDVVFVHPVTPNKNRLLRDKELAVITEEVKASKNPAVVFGDFNTTPFSYVFQRMLQDGGLVDSETGYGYQPTWNAKLPVATFPIDHVLVTSQFVTLERKVLESVGSDHLPVFVELGFKN